MDGLERLETQVLELNNYNISRIFEYLKTREDLYEKFNNEEKTINQMYEFICNRAEKQKVGQVAMIDDKVVYLWAIMYFMKSNKDLNLIKEEAKPIKIKKDIEKPKDMSQAISQQPQKTSAQISLFQEVE